MDEELHLFSFTPPPFSRKETNAFLIFIQFITNGLEVMFCNGKGHNQVWDANSCV